MRKTTSGFTLVELLIVIVVIAILAAISVVSYIGLQNRAHDSAIQSDLRGLGTKFSIYHATEGRYPLGAAVYADLDIQVTKSSYGEGFRLSTSEYNLLYCRVADSGPDNIAFVASSRSGNVFVWRNGSVQPFPRATWDSAGSGTICRAAGVNQVLGIDRDFFFLNTWASYVN